ncbi:SAM-dependent DNA methyltransferase, partial [bacterium]
MLPRWLERRYGVLWEEIGEEEFRFEEAKRVLLEQMEEDEEQVNAILNELKKRGVLEVKADPEDARKK